MKIYKYTPHIVKFINTSMLKITPVHQLNDPFEHLYTESALQSLSDQFSKNLGMTKGNAKKIASKICEGQKTTGIISFSKCPNSAPMLAYYANNHCGGILEFEIDSESPRSLFCRHELNLSWGDVSYTPFRVRKFFRKNEEDLSKIIAFQKSQQWEHEKEVRFVGDYRFADFLSIPTADRFSKKLVNRIIDDDRTVGVFPRNSDPDIEWLANWNSLIKRNWNDFHPLVGIERSALTGIFLGCNFPTKNIKKEALGEFNHLRGRIFCLDTNSESYAFDERNIYQQYIL